MFRVIKKCSSSRARWGIFKTAHNSFSTPAFFPVATQGAVKGISSKELAEIGIEGLLVNAYHLFLRPGVEVISQCGGLHKFMNFHKTIITDSGGYQIFSLNDLCRIQDEGVEFNSHIDGRKIFLTPEEVIKIQFLYGSDIVLPLDICLKFPVQEEKAYFALKQTIKWAKRSYNYFSQNKNNKTYYFGIIQGSIYNNLRKISLEKLLEDDIDGLCIGGLSVGEPASLRYEVLNFIIENAPDYLLRYFMGYGFPEDILEAVEIGVDLFDCVIPSRLGRTGVAFTNKGRIVIRNSPYILDTRPLDENCSCWCCHNFSRAYIRHLINAKEILGVQLVTYHNIYWYNNFMRRIREAIANDNFLSFKKDFLSQYRSSLEIDNLCRNVN